MIEMNDKKYDLGEPNNFNLNGDDKWYVASAREFAPHTHGYLHDDLMLRHSTDNGGKSEAFFSTKEEAGRVRQAYYAKWDGGSTQAADDPIEAYNRAMGIL